jgi:ABC-type sugar transport system ATPase subunit
MIKLSDFSIKLGNFELSNVNINIKKGEIFAVLGQTGGGKTVFLESVAGFYAPDRGEIFLDEKNMDCVPPEKRNVGFVYQDYALFPHLTVYKNIEFGLGIKKTPKQECKAVISELVKFLEIEHLVNRYPSTLSGGEQQRTALARALVLNPQILLMDEPFSALDINTKAKIFEVIKKIHKKYNCTIVFVTHNINEAKELAHRVGVIASGQFKNVYDISEIKEIKAI